MPSATPTAALSIEEISFSTGQSWVDITEHFPAQSDRTYHLEAAEGQILAIAIQQGRRFALNIIGDDGVSLTDQWDEPYWHGALPTTRGYSITIYNYQDTPSAADLTIRVALLPVGEISQVFAYHNDALGLSFNYPDLFAPMDYPDPNLYLPKDTQQLLSLALIDPTYFDGTNLGEAFLVVIASDTQGPECETGIKHEMFNGIDFAHFFAFAAGAGNLYEFHI